MNDDMQHEQAVESRAADRYLLGEMSELERYRFEAHFFSCADCAEEVRAGVALRDAVAGQPAEAAEPATAPTPAPVRESGQRLRLVSLAAAAVLCLAFGYQALVVVPGLRSLDTPRALTPVVLRPVTRGDDPVVAVPPDAPFVSLSLDVNLDPLPAELQYDLATAQGAAVTSGRIAAPAPGTPLLLLLPRRALAAGGHTLTVRPGDGSPGGLTYRFVVSVE